MKYPHLRALLAENVVGADRALDKLMAQEQRMLLDKLEIQLADQSPAWRKLAADNRAPGMSRPLMEIVRRAQEGYYL